MSDRLTIISISSLSLALIITFIVLCSCYGGFEAVNEDLQYSKSQNKDYSEQIQAQSNRILELEEFIEHINRGE